LSEIAKKTRKINMQIRKINTNIENLELVLDISFVLCIMLMYLKRVAKK